jgi:zinc transport system substrate-binding protein
MNRYGKYRPLALLLTALAAGCGQESPDESAGEPAVSGELNVVTVNYPLADPAYWSPDVAAISEYQQADLIILNGAGYAGWVANATLPRSRLVDTTAAVSDRLIPIEDTVTHTHGPGGDHSHGGTAFTTWLDLEIAQAQARAVLDALARARPELKEEFSQAFEKLKSDLAELDASLDEIGRKLRETPLLFSHPVYQYLERGYGLNAYTVHWEPDEVPEDAQWRHLQSVLQQHPAKIMVWEDEPLDETRRRLSELGVESIVFSPGGNRHVEGDWLTLMQEGISAMTALRASSDPHRN